MPSAEARGADIVALIAALECSVASAEDALVGRNWSQVHTLLEEQRQLTITLQSVLEASRAERPASFTMELQRRALAISERRDDQLRRLIAFNHAVGSRLSLFARAREMRRGQGDETSKPRIFDDLR